MLACDGVGFCGCLAGEREIDGTLVAVIAHMRNTAVWENLVQFLFGVALAADVRRILRRQKFRERFFPRLKFRFACKVRPLVGVFRFVVELLAAVGVTDVAPASVRTAWF